MKPMIPPRRMQECERAFFRAGSVPSIDVMERAPRALADAIAAELPAGGRIDFACGPGGNGGDGLACARMLNGQYRCRVFLTKPPTHPDAVENLRRAKLAGVTVVEMERAESTGEPACSGAAGSLSCAQDFKAAMRTSPVFIRKAAWLNYCCHCTYICQASPAQEHLRSVLSAGVS